MSTQDRQVIRNAIKYAEAEKNIVVLAAASNSSDREKLQFPANQDRYVICINSSDGFGRRSPFNPPKQESHKSDNFSILGEYVKSTWRQDADEVAGLIERDQSGIMWKWDKGTSVATAIAAAVIVLLFQFGRTAGKSHAFSALETPQAVRRIFHLMAGAKNDDQFKNIIPWRDVLNSDWSTDRIRHVIEAEIVHLL
jgi:subtilisin family serine protease